MATRSSTVKTRMTKSEYSSVVSHPEVKTNVDGDTLEAFWFERCTEQELPYVRGAAAFARHIEFGKVCMLWKKEQDTDEHAEPVVPLDPLLADLAEDDYDPSITCVIEPKPADLELFLFPQHTMLATVAGKQMPVARHHPPNVTYEVASCVELLCVTEIFNEHASESMARAYKVVLPVAKYRPERSHATAYNEAYLSIPRLLPNLKRTGKLTTIEQKKLAVMLTAQALNGLHSREESAEFLPVWDSEKLMIPSPW